MYTKRDVEKAQDNISPEIAPGMPPLIARSQKIITITGLQNADSVLELNIEKRS